MELARSQGVHYHDVLRRMHRALAPERYLEIGSETGASLQLSQCRSVAVDPAFRLNREVVGAKSEALVFQQTSDDFFAAQYLERLGWKVDFAFLDGMHQIEFLLRDFINTEANAAGDAVIAIHDILPLTEAMTTRSKANCPTAAWTGDVWKIIPILRDYRPDLTLRLIDCKPTGILVVEGLDPANKVLQNAYDRIVGEWCDRRLAEYGIAEFNALTRPREPGARAFRRTVWPSLGKHRNKLFFSIRHGMPGPAQGELGGEQEIVTGLAKALNALGHEAEAHPVEAMNVERRPNQVDIQLRGQPSVESSPGTLRLMWIFCLQGGRISEAAGDAADHVFVASPVTARLWADHIGADRVTELSLAFDPRAMCPPRAGKREGLLFAAGSAFHDGDGLHPIVELAMASGEKPEIWGRMPQGTSAGAQARRRASGSSDLGVAYGRAEAALCDHSALMRERGFVSNRLFDALACAAPVITDPVANLPEGFGAFVHMVETPEEFRAALAAIRAETDDDRARRREFASSMVTAHSFEARAREIVAVAQRIIGG